MVQKVRDKDDNDNKLISDLETALAINEHDLETSCREQPDTFYRVAKELALAISLKDEAHQIVKEIEAKADIDIRHDFETDGSKYTEKVVENTKMMDSRVIKARETHLALSHRVGLLSALKEAFQQRSYALNHLVDMYLSRQRSEVERTNTNYAEVARNALKVARKEEASYHGRR